MLYCPGQLEYFRQRQILLLGLTLLQLLWLVNVKVLQGGNNLTNMD